MPIINKTVLMSGVDFFSAGQAINPYMSKNDTIDLEKARLEHTAIREALETAGVKVITVPPPKDCQDGVYTANWALVRGNKAVMATLPDARKGEEAYARMVLSDLGKEVIIVPNDVHFSGQGDALPCGKFLLSGSGYRTELPAHQFVADNLGYEVISLQTIPQRNWLGKPVINKDSGWPDSFFYDIDLAISVLRDDLIAWCPGAFTKESQAKIRELPVEKIEVSLHEAKKAFACNLVSTGEVVVMSGSAPELKAAIESKGLRTISPEIRELVKGGGYIRCTTLTLDNPVVLPS
jgi:N-dimethylarginine dimethylaminohydrolase